MPFRNNRCLIAAKIATLLAIACLAGCEKSAGTATAADPKAFESAPAELKTQWDAVQAAAATNGYAVAIIGIRTLLKSPQLNKAQSDTLIATQTQLQNKMFEAAKQGDAAANADLNTLRSIPR